MLGNDRCGKIFNMVSVFSSSRITGKMAADDCLVSSGGRQTYLFSLPALLLGAGAPGAFRLVQSLFGVLEHAAANP